MSDQFTRYNKRTSLAGRMAKLQSEVKELWADCERLRRERDDLKRFAYEEAPKLAAEEANKQIDPLKTEIAELRRELTLIAYAQQTSFRDDQSFRLWAQNRARHALNQKPGELTIKKT
jgi:predicted RNase H-like nuclease (RuvC/YqgF family)